MSVRARRPRLRLLHPRLWNVAQYPPRALHLPRRYGTEKPPDDAPRIAIVTPSFNHAPFISATVESVLAQNYPVLAYLVQDGGSTDRTVEILRSFGHRLRWRSEPDGGQANALNRGFAGIDGEIMAYLNSDDMLLPGTLAYVARAFRDDPALDLVYGHRIFVDIEGREIGRAVLPPHDARALTWADYVPQETLFWRRRVWERIGPFDESFDFALDWDFILRAQAAGFRFARLPRFLACFRIHGAQKSHAMLGVGADEVSRLRARYLGRVPSRDDIKWALLGYLLRQVAFDWGYRCRLLRY
jgi:glycosyltransferase involved in cell wall biosynthesis